MLRRLILAAALAVGLASSAVAQAVPQVIATCGVGVSLPLGPGGRLYQDQTGILCTTAGSGGGGSGGATGSVTAAGTNGSTAQAVQGITGGVPQNSFPAQYNSTLPTFASGASGYLAVDSNGRLILSPGGSIAVTNAGTFAVQNTAPVVGGNSVAVKTDGSAVTQPISAASLPLPTGAATSANQASQIAALGTTGDSAYAGSGTASIIAALKGVYNATLAARAMTFADATNAALAASGATTATAHTLTAPIAYSKFNAFFLSNQTGTYSVQGSNDGFTTAFTVSFGNLTANASQLITVPITFTSYRAYITNGTTAATATVTSSFTAN